jgi:type II secretory pathway pseudopilin PulG
VDTSRHGTQRGFTLVEILVVIVVAMPILGSIFATSIMVRDQMQAGDTVSAVAESCRIAGQRVALLARAGLLSTCQVRATQADINAAIVAQATNPLIVIPTLGEWISPPVAEVRPTFRFSSADGVLSMNASALTPMREFEFFMDPGETANGNDDDGDGMVDEGRLQLRIGNSPVQLVLAGVETCEFSLNGRLMTVRLACARRDQVGRLYRAAATHTICMRNN